MEKNNKSQISTVLMIVGVIFIMIAGSIFVTTAWQHLSENGKRLILTGIVAALYITSWKLREKGILTKTEHALYYLAAAGTGFLTVSFLGGWSTVNGYIEEAIPIGTFNNADRAMWGLFATGIAISYRFIKERKLWDFGVLTFIFINMFFLVFSANVDNLAGIIPLSALTLLATIQYKDTNKIGYRIVQSFGYVFINHFFFFELYEMLIGSTEPSILNDKLWFYAPLLVDLVIMVVLKRMEVVCTALSVNWLLTFAQIIDGFNTWDTEDFKLYDIVPFALTTAISFMIIWKRTNEEKYKKLAVAGAALMGYEFLMYVVIHTEWFDDLGWEEISLAGMVACIMMGFVFAFVDCMLTNDIAKRIMKTIELVFGELAALFFVGTLDFDDFAVEAVSIFLGGGIVLLGLIWYDRAKGVRVAQFVLTCFTLFVLLMHNIDVEELSCLMFLGITGIIMLVVSAIKNRKEYVIASSVTLSLLALYLTREFWLSIAWWVYLFVAGIVLVGIAIKKEREA